MLIDPVWVLFPWQSNLQRSRCWHLIYYLSKGIKHPLIPDPIYEKVTGTFVAFFIKITSRQPNKSYTKRP